jgi:hypothetical protein
MHDFPKRPIRTDSFRLEGGNNAVQKPQSRQQEQEPQQQEEPAPRRIREQEDTASLQLEWDDEDDESSGSYSVSLAAMSPQAPRSQVEATTTAKDKKAHSCYESSMPALLSSSHGSFAGDASGLYLDLNDSVSSLDCSVMNERTRKRGSFPDLSDSNANILQPVRVLRDSSHREELRWGSSNHSNDSMPSYRKRIS